MKSMNRAYLRLTMLLALCLSTTIVKAQTDVTGQYLKNASFDEPSCWQSGNVATSSVANVKSVVGWEIEEAGGWTSGAAFGLGNGGQINSSALPSSASDGGKGGVLALSAGWGGAVVYSQTTVLPVGLYRITFPVQNVNSGATQSYNRLGLVESDGTVHHGTTVSFGSGSWVKEQLVFYNDRLQEITFRVGMEAVSEGSGNNAKLVVDGVKIEAYNAADFTNTTSKQGTFQNTASSWGGSGTYKASYEGTLNEGAETFAWGASLALGPRLQQTVSSLPEGLYEVDLLAAASSTSSRDNTNNVIRENSQKYNSLHVNGASVPVVASNRVSFSDFGHYTLRTIVGSDRKLTASFNEDFLGPNWLVVCGRTYRKLQPTVELSFPLPQGEVKAGFWYQVNIPREAVCNLKQTGSANISYTQDATKTATGTFPSTQGGELAIKAGVLYLKADGVTEITLEGAEVSYKRGDMDSDGTITLDDADHLKDVLLGKATSSSRADVNGDGRVNVADQTTLVDILQGNREPETVSDAWRSANIKAMVYAEQSAEENASSGMYMVSSAISTMDGSNVLSEVSIEPYLTTLMIDVTALDGVESVSICASDGTDIAGPATFTTVDAVLASASMNQTAPSTPYAASTRSDVVTVVGDADVYKAFLLPVPLDKGVKVTARCADGRFYSQDFMLTPSSVNHLAMSVPEAENLWMSTLPGNTRFNLLSTPGTHDAATYNLCSDDVLHFIEIVDAANGLNAAYGTLLQTFGTFRIVELTTLATTVCQSESIEQQLANGIRAFDLRPAYKGSASSVELDNLTIYHGTVSTGVLFKDVISTLVEFVKQHPSETVSVIMQKEESSGTDQSVVWRNSIRTCFQQYADYMVQDITPEMTLGDCRGKLVVVSKNPYGSENVYTDVVNGGKVEGWPENANSTTAYIYNEGGNKAVDVSVQDAYKASVANKKSYITEYANLASADNSPRWFYNFVSSASSMPLTVADELNVHAAEVVEGMDGRLGYVFGDGMGSDVYAGRALLRAVINQNYKYVNSGRTRVVR